MTLYTVKKIIYNQVKSYEIMKSCNGTIFQLVVTPSNFSVLNESSQYIVV